jgi:hypothetical protein
MSLQLLAIVKLAEAFTLSSSTQKKIKGWPSKIIRARPSRFKPGRGESKYNMLDKPSKYNMLDKPDDGIRRESWICHLSDKSLTQG